MIPSPRHTITSAALATGLALRFTLPPSVARQKENPTAVRVMSCPASVFLLLCGCRGGEDMGGDMSGCWLAVKKGGSGSVAGSVAEPTEPRPHRAGQAETNGGVCLSGDSGAEPRWAQRREQRWRREEV